MHDKLLGLWESIHEREWPLGRISTAGISLIAATVALVYVSDTVRNAKEARRCARVRAKLEQKGGKRPSVGIIGGGIGALTVAKKCRDMGLDFHIYEKCEQLGGTWFVNSCWLIKLQHVY
jgi:heterodisulfide reductase subunit A-like polyferredoxin